MSTEATFNAQQSLMRQEVRVYLGEFLVWTIPSTTWDQHMAEREALIETADRLGRLLNSAAPASTGKEETR